MKSSNYSSKQLKTKLPYLKDGLLYMLWKYLNGRRFIQKNKLSFEDIAPAGMSLSGSVMLFLATFYSLDLKLENPTFVKSSYDLVIGTTKDEELKAIKSNSITGTAITKILNGSFSFNDMLEGAISFHRLGMMYFFEFSNKLTKKIQSRLSTYLDFYIDEFVNDNLEIESQNYFKFSKQKKELIYILKTEEEKYGNQFILKIPDFIHYRAKEELFIHTLIALEKLGYFTIQDIWVSDMELPPEKQADDYKVRLVLSDQFYREIQPQSIPAQLVFNTNTSQLIFKNKYIDISKTKNSDPHYLLTILFKDKTKIWPYDEIWQDPYFHSQNEEYNAKSDWRKIYNAGYSVNEKVAKATTINDFLDITKTEISINKKYIP